MVQPTQTGCNPEPLVPKLSSSGSKAGVGGRAGGQAGAGHHAVHPPPLGGRG